MSENVIYNSFHFINYYLHVAYMGGFELLNCKLLCTFPFSSGGEEIFFFGGGIAPKCPPPPPRGYGPGLEGVPYMPAISQICLIVRL